MLNRKSQASLEYLTTYAWAFVVLIVSVGAIQYFGILDFQRYLPQKCTFTSQFKCTDFSLANGEVRVKVLNSIGENLKLLPDTRVTNTESPPLQCTDKFIEGNPFTSEVNWNNGDEINLKFTGCKDGGYLPNQRIEAVVELWYYSPKTQADAGLASPIIHKTKGRIRAVVSE